MDRLIKRFDAIADDDLMLVEKRGVAYQRNMRRGRIAYDAAYFEHYKALAGSSVERALNAGRFAMLKRHALVGARVLDVGVGNGSFLTLARLAGFDAQGSDVNPVALDWLAARDILAATPRGFDVATFWDSLEHIEEPERILRRINRGSVVLVAMPIFEALGKIRESKHYKPGEHLYYWTREGFVEFMSWYGYQLLEESEHEIEAGRESIAAFAFRRDLPGQDEYIEAYRELHSTRHYGSSATELHLDIVSEIVRANSPRSLLDYGCGRSDLVSHFYLDGRRRIARYDPAIPLFRDMPEGRFDLVLCCDVLEHIPFAAVDGLFDELKKKGDQILFTISTKPAKARLPDGSNAHCTLLNNDEWVRWLGEAFGEVKVLRTKAPHECNVLAGAGRKAKGRSTYRKCRCGGEVILDIYTPPHKPTEYFMRCTKSGEPLKPQSSVVAAEAVWARG